MFDAPLIAPWLADWLHLLIRWAHLVVGAAWIGASFYFNWLNNHVRPVAGPHPNGELAGGLWAVHGGAFYEVRKYAGAPNELPKTLHWFKWEAYLTWVTGVILLMVVYWLQADVMMVPADGPLSARAAAGVGMASLVVGWIGYDQLCKSPLQKQPVALSLVGFALMTVVAWGLSQVLSARAAFIHVGAMMGTMMALNVFFVIIPGQRAMVDAMMKGDEPDISKGKAGSLRSLHNNYLTLPVLFVMVSNHFPFTYGHEVGWAVLLAISIIGAGVRHWFNLKGKGHHNRWILPVAAVAMMGLAFVVHGPKPAPAPGVTAPTFAEVQPILDARCATCHADVPTWPGMTEPPKGLSFDDPREVQRNAALIYAQAVASEIMPMANLTEMKPEERALLGAWIDAGAPLEN
jgi:uncharacterized membrane protein